MFIFTADNPQLGKWNVGNYVISFSNQASKVLQVSTLLLSSSLDVDIRRPSVKCLQNNNFLSPFHRILLAFISIDAFAAETGSSMMLRLTVKLNTKRLDKSHHYNLTIVFDLVSTNCRSNYPTKQDVIRTINVPGLYTHIKRIQVADQ